MDPIIFVPFFVIALFGAIWWLVGLLLAHLSGWRSLAARHGDREASGGTRLRGLNARFGWVNFNHVLALEIDARGLRFSLWPKFLAGFAPFQMAWSDFASISEAKLLFSRCAELVPREGPKIQLFGRAVDAVLAASKPGARFEPSAPREDSALPFVLILATVVVVIAAAIAAFMLSGRS